MIYIPFDAHRHYVSGIVTFMQNLQAYLDACSYPYASQPTSSDVIFFPVQYDINIVRNVKEAGGIVVQRLDGVFHAKKHGNQYEELNRPMREIYSHYADFVVFQSQYSRQQCYEMFGKREEPTDTIIPNGVNKAVFFPEKRALPEALQKVSFITTGGFRNKDMLEPIIRALDQLTGTLDFELVVVGPVHHDSVWPYLKKEYVRYEGRQDSPKLAELLRKADIFLYSIANPACPNSVIEAISCGVPVVGFDSGAMRELCFFSPELLAYVSDDVFQQYEDFQPNRLKEKIQLAVSNYPYFREQALQHSYLYAFEATGAAYIRVFDQMRQQAAQTFDAPRYKQLERKYRRKSQVRHWYVLAKSKLYGLAKRILPGNT